MDHAKARASGERQYEDFQASTEWVEEKGSRTFIVYLSGFRKEQLKVQVTSTQNMRISGERPLGNHKWSRFREECPIPSDCDISLVSAKFEGGMLYVKLPKKTTPEVPQEKEELKSTPEDPKAPAKKAQQENKGQDRATDHHPSAIASATRNEDKQTEKKSKGHTKEEEKKAVTEKTKEKSRHEETKDAKEKGADGLAEARKLASTSSGKVELRKFTKSATDLAMRLKRPKALVNLAVGVLVVAVLMLYVTNAIRFLGKPKDAIQ